MANFDLSEAKKTRRLRASLRKISEELFFDILGDNPLLFSN